MSHNLPRTTYLEMNEAGIGVQMHLNPERLLSAIILFCLPVKYTLKAN